ncbi:hypothetical protein KI688_006126 [Linnemannia hyalina]|uniref:Uncharacterized protein n=1 Tax=Linnemannia hyalina TaxID=64524 RepID=A0A9P8BZN3_9FUNG|nr:hypothetical protein KI688_006126 [Linnemannia hyalina]
MSTLQFSTRAQAMGFLINLLQSFQQEPCECDLVQGCFCSPEGVEDHSGLAPCYVCGEWYAEEVYCSGDEGGSSSYRKVDGRSWHERGGASLRHQVAERRVQQWLDQVVVPVASAATWPSSPYYHQQQQQQQQPHQPHHYQQEQQQDEKKEQQTQQQSAVIRSRPGRSASCPSTFSIPEEIMDPTIRRTPGFCIKRRDTIATERPASLPFSPTVEQVPATSYSAPSSASSTLTNSKSTPFRFSFTSERFNAAVQESLSRRSSTITTTTSTSSTAVVPQQQLPSSNINTNINNSNTMDNQAEAVAEQQTEAELGMEAETEAEAVRVAETETASTSAQTTSSSFVSSPSFTSSRRSPPSSSTAAGKINHRDQCGVVKEPSTAASSIVAQQPSSTLSSSASMALLLFLRHSNGKKQEEAEREEKGMVMFDNWHSRTFS